MQEVQLQVRWTINDWYGIVENKVIGRYFVYEPLSAEIYLNFILNMLPVLLEMFVCLETRKNSKIINKKLYFPFTKVFDAFKTQMYFNAYGFTVPKIRQNFHR